MVFFCSALREAWSEDFSQFSKTGSSVSRQSLSIIVTVKLSVEVYPDMTSRTTWYTSCRFSRRTARSSLKVFPSAQSSQLAPYLEDVRLLHGCKSALLNGPPYLLVCTPRKDGVFHGHDPCEHLQVIQQQADGCYHTEQLRPSFLVARVQIGRLPDLFSVSFPDGQMAKPYEISLRISIIRDVSREMLKPGFYIRWMFILAVFDSDRVQVGFKEKVYVVVSWDDDNNLEPSG